jgi:hypothetical protein
MNTVQCALKIQKYVSLYILAQTIYGKLTIVFAVPNCGPGENTKYYTYTPRLLKYNKKNGHDNQLLMVQVLRWDFFWRELNPHFQLFS